MTVEINRHTVEVPAGAVNLAQLLTANGLDGAGTAVAVGDAVVPRSAWGDTPLSENMKITVISAVCGG